MIWDDIDACGRWPADEGGRVPPTLLEKEVFDTCRIEDTEGGREEVEDEYEVCRENPAIDVALTAALTGLELGGAGVGLKTSPAVSAKVLRLKAPEDGGSMVDLALLTEAVTSTSFSGEGIRLGCGSWETNCRYREPVSNR